MNQNKKSCGNLYEDLEPLYECLDIRRLLSRNCVATPASGTFHTFGDGIPRKNKTNLEENCHAGRRKTLRLEDSDGIIGHCVTS